MNTPGEQVTSDNSKKKAMSPLISRPLKNMANYRDKGDIRYKQEH